MVHRTRIGRTILALGIAGLVAAPGLVQAQTVTRRIHMFVPGRAASTASTNTGGSLLYFGGPVVAQAKVVIVLWGSNVAKATAAGVKPFFQPLTNSNYTDQMAQYSTVGITGVNGRPGTNQTIRRGSVVGKFRITPANTSKNLTDGDIQTELQGQIAAGVLPAYDANTLYMLYFPASITISLGKYKSCVYFGGYHEGISSGGTPLLAYGVMPDCNGGFASMTIVSSHEYAEAVTDVLPTPGSNPDYPQAWNDANGYEVGDLCEGRNATLTRRGTVYTVQEIFNNATNACATGNFTSP